MPILYEMEALAGMKRSELQKLAKQNGIKANMKTDGLIKALAAVVDSNLKPNNLGSSEQEETTTSTSSNEDQSEVEASEEKPKSRRGRGRKQKNVQKATYESPLKERDLIAGGDSATISLDTESENQTSNLTEDENVSPVAKKSKAKPKGRGRGKRGRQTKEETMEGKTEQGVIPAAVVLSSPVVSDRRTRSLQKTPEPTLPTPPNSGSSRKMKRAIRRNTHTPQPGAPAQPTISPLTPDSAPSSNKRSSSKTFPTATSKTTPAANKTPTESKTRGSTGKRSASGSAGGKTKKVRRGTFDKSPAKVTVEKNNSTLKDEIMAEIDRKVQMHVAKSKSCIPTRVQSTKKTPSKKNWSKTHHGALDKMESIDAYLERKQKRAEALSASKKHRIPAVAKPAVKAKGFNFGSPKPSIKLQNFNFASPKPTKMTIPTNPKSAKTVSFKVSKLKTPKKVTMPSNVSAPAVEKRKATPGVRKSISVLTPGSVVRKSIGGVTPGNGRKSFGGSRTPSRKSVGGVNAGNSRKSLTTTKTPSRKSVGGAVTPFGKQAMATSATKPKNVFDLKASLSKPLSYKPHAGKLKPFGENQMNNANIRAPSNLSTAKTMIKKPQLKGRGARRASNMKHRNQKRNESFMANRGITAC